MTVGQRADLVGDLRRLGVREGGVLLVQSSLRAVGRVPGGARTVVHALREALGPQGTLVAYTGTPENSLSSQTHRNATAGLDAAGLRAFLRAMPPFEPERTPCVRSMGRLAEEIRTTPGAIRSAHPQASFAAIGPLASRIVGSHPLESHLGDLSPLGRLYDEDAEVLMLGLPSWKFTPYHLAEYRVADPPVCHYAAVVPGPAAGSRRWIVFQGVDLDDRPFPELGAAVRQKVAFGEGRVGDAACLLVPIVPAVDVAADLMTEARKERLLPESAQRRSRRMDRGFTPAELLG
jgi:aminoglycoside 3-N-acetyltransferase